FQQIGGLLPDGGPRAAAVVGEVLEVLQRGEAPVEVAVAFQYGAEVLHGLQAPGAAVVPAHQHAPLVGVDEAAHHLDGGGLPGAVGPEQTDDLALVNAEAHVLDGLDGFLAASFAVALVDVVHHHEIGHLRSSVDLDAPWEGRASSGSI